jgi:hypothetical protein
MADLQPQKHPGGRPISLTPEALSKLRNGFMIGFTDEEACIFAGISHATYYREKARNKKFSEDVSGWKKNPY